MNIRSLDLLRSLANSPFVSQRELAAKCECSLGQVNRCLSELREAALLTEENTLTPKAQALLASSAPKRAIILAAGIGMRMVPINTLTPKAFLQVQGESLIERLIRQLQEAGIRDITLVVGFMKERFDHLIDAYGVKLVVNSAYAEKNNLSSLALVSDQLANAYVLPCDLWFRHNPFRRQELYSWYAISRRREARGLVRANRKRELVRVRAGEDGNVMVGLAYLLEQDAASLRERLLEMALQPRYDTAFWEDALLRGGSYSIPARVFGEDQVTEINTYEQLRDLDVQSEQLKSDAIDVITQALGCEAGMIRDIRILKKGMTNRSFLFRVGEEKYIMRIPGEGTDQLINRRQEATVFQTISGLGLCDDPVYINPENGYKITRYLEGVRVCDPDSVEDLQRCMALLKRFHAMKLRVAHSFDIFGQIEFYERLWEGAPSAFQDYAETKQKVLSLRGFLDSQPKECCLTHIDAVPDNFLFYRIPGEDRERLQLTDWEYAGMQDPHVDIAMFCIYSLYDKAQIDRLIDIYFAGDCGSRLRAKIYCYVAACGLLWSNWTEYKRNLGVEFGEYGLRQYRYAKDYCRFAREELEKKE